MVSISQVRYQSRKRLAEQRPRVKGQFVRRIVYDNSNCDVDYSFVMISTPLNRSLTISLHLRSDSEGGKNCSSNGLISEGNSSDSVR